MNIRSSKFRSLAAFSIAEVMLAGAVASLLMGGLISGSVALQRTFDASDWQARAEADVNRLVDYVARDIGSASTVNTTANGTVLLTVTKGDYYDRRGTLNDPSDDLPNAPVLGRYGAGLRCFAGHDKVFKKRHAHQPRSHPGGWRRPAGHTDLDRR